MYAQELRPEHYQLFTIRPDGSGAKRITHLVNAASPDWSPNGRTIVAEATESKSGGGITLLSAMGNVIRNLTPTGERGQPSFSPDGKWIVYESDISANGIFLMRTNGTAPAPRHEESLRGRTSAAAIPTRTSPPNGKLITFVRIKKDGKQQALFAVRPNGTGLRQVTPYSWEVAIKHDWSPDGKLIVLTTNADFVRPNQSANLVTIRPDGSGMKNLTGFTAGSENAFAGSFSPARRADRLPHRVGR